MSKEIERRTVGAAELRVQQDEAARIVGHAALFNSLSQDLGGFRERIMPGAFRETLAADDVRALFNHDPSFVLGRNRSGTLRLSEDDQGLKIEIDPPNTQIARDLMTSIGRGDITQMSFGFMVKGNGQSWSKAEDGGVLRTLTDLRLCDVSVVTYPAYQDTHVAVRALNVWRSTCPSIGLLRRRLALTLIN
jgi:HK97 family phage prohead protease